MIKSENGRSMVEMLGVLAIIGVLSVGAIAGYSKAMMKYKLNKLSDQMNHIMSAVSRNTSSFNNLSEGASLTNLFIKMGEIPNAMVKNSNDVVYDVFNNAVSISVEKSSSMLAQAGSSIRDTGGEGTSNPSPIIIKSKNEIHLNYSLTTTDSNTAVEVCKALFILAKEQSGDINRIFTQAGRLTLLQDAISVSNEDNQYFGDKYCTNNCLKNISVTTISDICSGNSSSSIAEANQQDQIGLLAFVQNPSSDSSGNSNGIQSVHFVWKTE